MRPLEELIDRADQGIVLLREWRERARNDCELLPPATTRDEALYKTQVTTHSLLGTIVYETGGLLIDNGWLRFIGSGSARLQRSLPEWNAEHANGFYLVADDAVGGFFALNQGALGEDLRSLYYLPPTTLRWECLEVGYTDFLHHAITGDFASFYEDVRWPNWRVDVSLLSADRTFSFYPPLWTKEGSTQHSHRGTVPVAEAFVLALDLQRQFNVNK